MTYHTSMRFRPGFDKIAASKVELAPRPVAKR